MKSIARRLLAMAGLAAAFTAPTPAALALEPLSVLSAEWWKWMTSIPVSQNPLLDETGERCMVGQRSLVWFLAGSRGDPAQPIVRTCAVPEGAWLFFPVANVAQFDSPNACQDENRIPLATLRANAAAFVNGLSNIAVELDGKAIPARLIPRVRSIVFAVALPEDNVFDDPCAPLGGMPAGIFSPTVADGRYVLLPPLARGKTHTLHFHAENDEAGFVLDVTYKLTVVDVRLD